MRKAQEAATAVLQSSTTAARAAYDAPGQASDWLRKRQEINERAIAITERWQAERGNTTREEAIGFAAPGHGIDDVPESQRQERNRDDVLLALYGAIGDLLGPEPELDGGDSASELGDAEHTLLERAVSAASLVPAASDTVAADADVLAADQFASAIDEGLRPRDSGTCPPRRSTAMQVAADTRLPPPAQLTPSHLAAQLDRSLERRIEEDRQERRVQGGMEALPQPPAGLSLPADRSDDAGSSVDWCRWLWGGEPTSKAAPAGAATSGPLSAGPGGRSRASRSELDELEATVAVLGVAPPASTEKAAVFQAPTASTADILTGRAEADPMPVFPVARWWRSAGRAVSSIAGGTPEQDPAAVAEAARLAERFPEHRGTGPRAVLGLMAATVTSPLAILAELAVTATSTSTAAEASSALVGLAGRSLTRWLLPALPAVAAWFVTELVCRHAVDTARVRLLSLPATSVESRRVYAARRAARKAEVLQREARIAQAYVRKASFPGRPPAPSRPPSSAASADPPAPVPARLAAMLQARYRRDGAVGSSIAGDVAAAGPSLPADVLGEIRRFVVLRPVPAPASGAEKRDLRPAEAVGDADSLPAESGGSQAATTARSDSTCLSLADAPGQPRLWPARPAERWDEVLEASYEALPAEPTGSEQPASSLASRALAGAILGGVAGALMWRAREGGPAGGAQAGGPAIAGGGQAAGLGPREAPARPASGKRAPSSRGAVLLLRSFRGVAVAGAIGMAFGACLGGVIPPYEAIVRGLRADKDATRTRFQHHDAVGASRDRDSSALAATVLSGTNNGVLGGPMPLVVAAELPHTMKTVIPRP